MNWKLDRSISMLKFLNLITVLWSWDYLCYCKIVPSIQKGSMKYLCAQLNSLYYFATFALSFIFIVFNLRRLGQVSSLINWLHSEGYSWILFYSRSDEGPSINGLLVWIFAFVLSPFHFLKIRFIWFKIQKVQQNKQMKYFPPTSIPQLLIIINNTISFLYFLPAIFYVYLNKYVCIFTFHSLFTFFFSLPNTLFWQAIQISTHRKSHSLFQGLIAFLHMDEL